MTKRLKFIVVITWVGSSVLRFLKNVVALQVLQFKMAVMWAGCNLGPRY